MKINKEISNWIILGLIIVILVLLIVCSCNDEFTPRFFESSMFKSPDNKLFDRPIISRPLYFRPSLHPLLRDRIVPKSRCKYIKKMDSGFIRIPGFNINNNLLLRSQFNDVESNSWTIAFKAKVMEPKSDLVMFKKGIGSPMIKYIGSENSLLLKIDTVFKGVKDYKVSLGCIDKSKYNDFAWVQHGSILRFYINGLVVFRKELDNELSAPVIIARGPLFIVSDKKVVYRDIYVCNSAWLQKN